MALIKCPQCGKEISDRAIKCPQCKKIIKKNKTILFFTIVIFIIFMFAYCGWKHYRKIQNEKYIEKLLIKVETLYTEFDFDGIEKCYDALDKLEYNTSTQREILEYDRNVYEDAYAYYVAIKNVNDKVHNGTYGSLRALINTMEIPTKNFETLEINSDSEIGRYIERVRNNVIYDAFNSEYLNSTKLDLDSGLTSWGYEYLIGLYTEEIVAEKFPHIE